MLQPGIKTTTLALAAPAELIPGPEHSFRGKAAETWQVLGKGSTGIAAPAFCVTFCHMPLGAALALHPLLNLNSLCIYALTGARVQHFELLLNCVTFSGCFSLF